MRQTLYSREVLGSTGACWGHPTCTLGQSGKQTLEESGQGRLGWDVVENTVGV